jgi:hypothetical protein
VLLHRFAPGVRLALLVLLALGPVAGLARPLSVAAQTAGGALEEPVVGPDGSVLGRHFRQTGDGSALGFDVRAPFLQPFLAIGGGPSAGYPISVPFLGADACAYQAFQVVLLQRCGDGDVRLANTFEILQDAGVDPQLDRLGIGPGESDPSATFDEALLARRGWLEDAAIRDRYLSQCGGGDYAAAVGYCGLPMNHPRSAGPFVSQRFQRIAFQRWLQDGPSGIRTGDVTAVLGGNLLKDTGVLIGIAVQPHVIGRPPAPPPVTFARPALAPGAATASGVATTLTPARRTVPLGYGFQADMLTPDRRRLTVSRTQEAGFGWVKQQLVWANFEMTAEQCRRQGPGCFETTINGTTKYFWKNQLDELERLLNDVRGSGLNILVSVVRAPDFYAAPQGIAPADPTRLRDFLQFLTTHPQFRSKINAIEPWNEQNLSWEWGGARLWPNAPNAPPQGVVDFLQLQKAAYQGVKSGDPAVLVVLPALTPTGVGECWRNPEVRTQRFCLDGMRLAIDDALYLEFLYSLNNGEIKQYYDVLGVHPSGYNNPPDDWTDSNSLPASNPASGRYKGHGSFYLKRFRQLREIQERAGDTKPMWITEMGWSSTRNAVPGYEFGIDNSEEQRGRYFARMLEIVNAEAPYVTQVFIWNLNWRQLVPESDERYGFSILDPNGAPLPAFTCSADYVRNGGRTTRPECRT